MNEQDLWAMLRDADPAINVSPSDAEASARFESLVERRDTMGSTFRQLERTPPKPPPTRRRAVFAGALAFVLVIAVFGASRLIRDPGPEPDRPVAAADPTTPEATTLVVGVVGDPSGTDDPQSRETDEGTGPAVFPINLDQPWSTGTVFEPDPEARVVRTPAIATNGERVVIVGSMATDWAGESWAAVWTSDDGNDWTRVPQDAAIFGPILGGWTTITDVTAGGPGFVAIGRNERFEPISWVSADGIAWSRSEYVGTVELHLDSVAAWEGVVVAAGAIGERDAPVILVSDDGLNWIPALPPLGMTITPDHELRVVATSSGLLLFADGVWRSTDGLEWIRDSDGPANYVRGHVAAGPLGVAAISELGRAVSLSVDGIEWSTTFLGSGAAWDEPPFDTDAEPVEMVGILALGQGFVAVGTDYVDWNPTTGGTVAAVYMSLDGATWARLDVDHYGGVNERIVDAVAFRGTIIGVGFTADGLDGKSGATWVSRDGE